MAPPRTAADWRANRPRPAVADGYVVRDGVRVFWEAFGAGEPAILMLPTWSVVHAAHGRFQIADLARRHRVVTFDPRGNGRSDRPSGPAAYDDREFVADALAVLDASGTERAVLVGCSQATYWLLGLAADHPDRVLAAVASGTNLPLAPGNRTAADVPPFDGPVTSTEGWAKWNAAYWRDDYVGFLRFFFSEVWNEPSSASVIVDAVTWGLETTPETLIDTALAPGFERDEVTAMAARVGCPLLVIHGAEDAVTPVGRGARFAELARGRLAILAGSGHCPGNRDPVAFDRLILDFVAALAPGATSARLRGDGQRVPGRRALIVPSGVDERAAELGVAIGDALRASLPAIEVTWLAPPPVRDRLVSHGVLVHPASAELLDERMPGREAVAGLEEFDVWRRGDEARFANFMVFDELTAREPFDLVISIGAQQVDRYLHEHPELKRFTYAWITDRVAWGVADEVDLSVARLSADTNAGMAALVEARPDVRDLAVYLGAVDDLGDGSFGSGLPSVRDWPGRRYVAVGRVGDGERIAAAAADITSRLMTLLQGA